MEIGLTHIDFTVFMLLDRLIPEELMPESKTYQRQMERAAERVTRETTIRHILTLLKRQFRPETVNALNPCNSKDRRFAATLNSC